MATFTLKNGDNEIEVEIRESDSFSKDVLIRMTRFNSDGQKHIADLFLDPRQAVAFGDFIRYEAIEIEIDQARESYEAEADTQSTR